MKTLDTNLPASKLATCTKTREYHGRQIMFEGRLTNVRATVRYDDTCRNGHNSFAITGEYTDVGQPYWKRTSGCIHEAISAAFPELAPFIKWHFCSTDGPMHYIANTVYHAQNDDLEHARSSAIWPDATKAQLFDKQALSARLPALMVEFKAAIESLGFTY